MRALALATAAFAAAVAFTTGADAAAPPVGPLPAGPTATLTTTGGELVAVALPKRAGGKSWRVARAFDGTVIQQVSEASVGSSFVLVFKAGHAGTTKLVFALTRGETSKAFEARTFSVLVR